jgi:UDPglucose--hexose-1-phosphate uridylyltransferase
MGEKIFADIERLLQYGLKKQLISEWDVEYTRNRLLEVLGLDEWKQVEVENVDAPYPTEILNSIVDWAAQNDRLTADTITYRDLLDTKLMGCLVPRPAEVIKQFTTIYDNKGPKEATEYFYQLSKETDYIRTERIAKNEHWFSETDYGNLEITINLSKPEKDPTAIAAAKELKQSEYPQCLLCKENVGYRGRVNHPARQNHRVVPVTLKEEQWYLQFSPYVYYNEHAIAFSGEHRPMMVSQEGFGRLLHFVDQYPHYFIGSNADLPIVGGSILSHDHFQAGHHEFPMAKAEIEKRFTIKGFEDITVGIVRWPMSVIRVQGKDRGRLVELGGYILEQWKGYSDENAGVYAFSGDTPHNTITPIARKRDGLFELDLVLRNNRKSEEHPLGIYHPHEEVHHIKKENIGLIEVMGLAVLPGRLKEEMALLESHLLEPNGLTKIQEDEKVAKHAGWAAAVKAEHPELTEQNVQEILKVEVGKVFSTVLEHAGVFKRNEEGQRAFVRFVETL